MSESIDFIDAPSELGPPTEGYPCDYAQCDAIATHMIDAPGVYGFRPVCERHWEEHKRRSRAQRKRYGVRWYAR